ncbi:MAG: sulfatase [Verrucomicrobiae bacterium]|nr:sulfatase [Verrucomicrobiae bacterium]
MIRAPIVALLLTAWAAHAAKPNIIVLLADDMRWDAMSCAGNPALQTPNIDRLAAEGTLFRNAFVTTSICSVSRASILTGQYARRHGIHDFKTPLADLGATYPAILRKAGYWTGFMGKWGTAQNDRDYFRRCAESFDFWAGDMGQTSYWHARGCNYVTNDGTTNRANFFCDCPQEARAREGTGDKGPHPALKDPIHLETQIFPAKIRTFLEGRDPAKPFCLSVSFKAPHGPWGGCAPEFAGAFAGAAMPSRPNVSREDALRQPDFLRASLESDRGLRFAEDPSPDGPLQDAQRQYYRLILGVDRCIGELLGELQKRDLARDTVIIFTSDNGHFLGEHGFFGKWLMHEESIRVPLIVSGPAALFGKHGQTCDEMALNIDIAPTALDLAAIPVPPSMQGRSLQPQLQQPARPVRESFFYEHLYEHAPAPPRHIEPCEGVRTRDWKYISYIRQNGPAAEALFDLKNDPFETTNLVSDRFFKPRLIDMRQRIEMFRRSLK